MVIGSSLSDSARAVLAAWKATRKPASLPWLAKTAGISEARARNGAAALCEAGLATMRGIVLTLTSEGKAWRYEPPRQERPIEETPGLIVGRMVGMFMNWEPTPEGMIDA